MRSTLSAKYFSVRLRILLPYYHQLRFKNMKPPHNHNQPISSKSQIPANSRVDKFQKIIHSDTTDGWDKCWEEGLTPWDLGRPTPILVHLRNTGLLPKGRFLVPGCGSGYDVVAIACAEQHVVGVDISENAINKAIELSSGSPNAEHFTFIRTEFFNWHPAELFDYTFFCAIEPELRSQWARKISDLLNPERELITLMYPIDDHEGGPPYKVSVTDHEEVLHPVGLKATHISDNEWVIAPHRGREKLGRWKKILSQSSL